MRVDEHRMQDGVHTTHIYPRQARVHRLMCITVATLVVAT
jgi:hypothetical protein